MCIRDRSSAWPVELCVAGRSAIKSLCLGVAVALTNTQAWNMRLHQYQRLLVTHRPLGRQGRRSEAPARMVAHRARLVPRLTIRPSLLTLAVLAPLTAGAGVGNRRSPIDVGPSGAKSAPPGINRKGETPWQPSPQSPWQAT